MANVVALYSRISLDDEKQGESESVQNQRNMLRDYVAADCTLSSCEVLEFADDGWSGTNFDRPQVQKLLELARRGEVYCIIVKDLSRWGRNYPEVNEYLDRIFPFLRVRFISVNDQYDSNNYRGRTAPIDVAFSSIMHNIYSKELSVKIRQSYVAKANKGEYVCGQPPFGYLRSTTQRNQLIIDEAAASTVRRIFSMAAEGLSCAKIAAALNADKVDTALMHRIRKGIPTSTTRLDQDGQTYWASAQVLRIVRDERYTGILICFKSKREKLGSRKQVKQPESEWLRIPNTHEAIVTAEQFEAANERLRRNKFSSPRGIQPNRSPFTGKIICGHCNRAMRQQNSSQPYHYCAGVKLQKGKGCFEGKVFYEHLKEVVLSAVKVEAQKAFDAQRRRKQTVCRAQSDGEAALAERKRLMTQIAYFERRSIALYEEFADGKLGREDYRSAKDALADELTAARERIAELTVQVEQVAAILPVQDNESLLRRVLEVTEVTEEVISLVDCVVVYDPEHIEIRFAFADGNVTAGGIKDGE